MRDGLEIAYVREGEGGYPLLLLHGWPETKRIWWRNIEPLAAAGFEVIVPDLRGFGDSGLAPDGFYDPATHARDLHALVARRARPRALRGRGRRRRRRRDPGPRPALRRLRRAPVPVQHGAAAAARASTRRPGIPPRIPREVRMAADYFLPPGPRRRRARRRARHAREAAPLHRAVLRLALLGRAGHLHRRRTSTS